MGLQAEGLWICVVQGVRVVGIRGLEKLLPTVRVFGFRVGVNWLFKGLWVLGFKSCGDGPTGEHCLCVHLYTRDFGSVPG